MIINRKIKEFLNGNLNNLKPDIKKKIEKDEKIRIYSILNYFSFQNLNYSFEDFIADGYGENIKEKKALYLLLSEYKSVRFFCEVHGLDIQVFPIVFRKGIDKLPKSLYNKKDIFMKYFEKEYNLNGLKIEFYKKHIELFGKKELLENFKNKHNIIYPVRYEPVKESWHLAFDGPLAEYIKYNEQP